MTGYNAYPQTRLRRLRGTDPLRNLARETRLSPKEFIYPMFVMHGHGVREPIEPMPGCNQVSLDVMSDEVGEAAELGIGGVLLFGLPAEKDPLGTEGYDPEGIVQEAVRTIKRDHPEMLVSTDICMCEYTDHGHCGVIDNGRIDNGPDPGAVGAHRSDTRAGRSRPAGAVGHDGRPGLGHPAGAERRRLRRYANYGLRRQVRLRFLWALSSRRRLKRPSSATASPTRWTRPTRAWPCGRSKATSPRVRTS